MGVACRFFWLPKLDLLVTTPKKIWRRRSKRNENEYARAGACDTKIEIFACGVLVEKLLKMAIRRVARSGATATVCLDDGGITDGERNFSGTTWS